MKRYFKKNYLTYNSNEIIKLENEKCEEIGYIVSGKVIIKNYYLDGHESTIRILKNDEIFGLNLIFSNHPFYRGTIEAATETKICFLTKNELLDIMKTDFDLTLSIINKLSSDFQYFNALIKILFQKNNEAKICLSLKFFNKSTDSNTIKLPFSFKKLSEIIHINRSSLFRSLKVLENKNIIKRDKKVTYILNEYEFYNLIQ